jgi:hypothetical protein
VTPTENVLGRLHAVRQRQLGQHSARCPAHEDRGPSLSVRETPEGSVLLHCFAGCAVGEIVAALGLQPNDLFPPRDRPAGAPKRIANLLTAGQALDLLANESTLVALAAGNVANGATLNPSDITRVMTAAGRINFLRDQTKGRGHA